ncbi:MAG: DUF924 family protein [Pseudomonadota bacterium]
MPWHDEILAYWFETLSPPDWFQPSTEIDRVIEARFAGLIDDIASKHPTKLVETPDTALAAVLMLDQVPRNVFRNSAKAFAQDAKALALSKAIVENGLDKTIPLDRRLFAYLPFEHSENLDDQVASVELITALGDDQYTHFAKAHHDVIQKFGRFPHRNQILGRQSTQAEIDYLSQPGAGFG